MVVSNCLATNFECSTYLLFKKKTWNYMCSARCFISYFQLICSHQNIKTPDFYHCSGRFYYSPPQHKNSHRFPPTFFQLKITVKISRTFLLQLADINTSSFHRLQLKHLSAPWTLSSATNLLSHFRHISFSANCSQTQF